MDSLTQAIEKISKDIALLQENYNATVNNIKSSITNSENKIGTFSSEIDEIQTEIDSVKDRYEKAVTTEFPEEKKRIEASMQFIGVFGVDSIAMDNHRVAVDTAEKKFISDSETKLKELSDKLVEKRHQIDEVGNEINSLNTKLKDLELSYTEKNRLLKEKFAQIESVISSVSLDTSSLTQVSDEGSLSHEASIKQLEEEPTNTRVDVTDMINDTIAPDFLNKIDEEEKTNEVEETKVSTTPVLPNEEESVINPFDISAVTIPKADDSEYTLETIDCPGCSATISKNMEVCPICGTKLNEKENELQDLADKTAFEIEKQDRDMRNGIIAQYNGLGLLNVDDTLIDEIITSVKPEDFNKKVKVLEDSNIKLSDLGVFASKLITNSAEEISATIEELKGMGKTSESIKSQIDIVVSTDASTIRSNHKLLIDKGKKPEEISILELCSKELNDKIEKINASGLNSDAIMHQHPYLFSVLTAAEFMKKVLKVNDMGGMKL